VTSKLPQEYKSNYVEVINEKIISTFNPLKNNLVKAAYGLESSGYSSDVKKLGGPINLNDKLVLSVNADRSEYLRGSIKDNYNGFSWSKNKQDYSLKINEKHNVLSSKNFSPGFASNGKKLLVYLDQNTNSSIFAPMYTYNVKLDKGDVFYDDAPTFIADLSKVKSYSVDYYDNLETQAFENCSDLDWLKESLNQGDSSEFKKKYENYLQVPSTITQRTKTLLTDFSTLGASRYASISKMKEYLDINYPYTTSVSPVPKDQDFIDNFLFTEKKGYCVYFATAATVLSRMMGIPARYVEGFKMPESKDSEGLYKVTNKEAHAWCEVLVDPIHDIWTTLEVTPAAVSNQVPEVIPEPIVEVSKTIAKPEVKLPSTVKNNADPTNNISLGSYKISKVGIGMYIFLSIVILLIAKILTTLGGIKKILRRKSIIPYYKYCVKRLKQIGIVKKSNLGDLEYVEQLEDKALKVILKDIVIIAYEEFYGKKFEGDINRENSYKELENFIKRKEKKSLYFIKKYLFF